MSKTRSTKSKPPRFYVPPFLPCGSCSDGWLMNAAGEAYRCWCWLQFLERGQAEETAS